jgi:hypothetical protein
MSTANSQGAVVPAQPAGTGQAENSIVSADTRKRAMAVSRSWNVYSDKLPSANLPMYIPFGYCEDPSASDPVVHLGVIYAWNFAKMDETVLRIISCGTSASSVGVEAAAIATTTDISNSFLAKIKSKSETKMQRRGTGLTYIQTMYEVTDQTLQLCLLGDIVEAKKVAPVNPEVLYGLGLALSVKLGADFYPASAFDAMRLGQPVTVDMCYKALSIARFVMVELDVKANDIEQLLAAARQRARFDNDFQNQSPSAAAIMKNTLAEIGKTKAAGRSMFTRQVVDNLRLDKSRLQMTRARAVELKKEYDDIRRNLTSAEDLNRLGEFDPDRDYREWRQALSAGAGASGSKPGGKRGS